MGLKIQINERDMRRAIEALKRMPVNMQRKVLTQAVNNTTRQVILPEVVAKTPVRTQDVWNAAYPKRGLLTPMQSHLTPPGTLRSKLKVVPGKRSRVSISRRVTTPTRDELGVPAGYPGYYPAFIEYGYVTPSGRRVAPRPYLRGVLERHKGAVMTNMTTQIRSRMNRLRKA